MLGSQLYEKGRHVRGSEAKAFEKGKELVVSIRESLFAASLPSSDYSPPFWQRLRVLGMKKS